MILTHGPLGFIASKILGSILEHGAEKFLLMISLGYIDLKTGHDDDDYIKGVELYNQNKFTQDIEKQNEIVEQIIKGHDKMVNMNNHLKK